MSNSVEPDVMAHYEPHHLDLRCLKKPIVISYDSEGVNQYLGCSHMKYLYLQLSEKYKDLLGFLRIYVYPIT